MCISLNVHAFLASRCDLTFRKRDTAHEGVNKDDFTAWAPFLRVFGEIYVTTMRQTVNLLIVKPAADPR